jgi:hypothetical protein
MLDEWLAGWRMAGLREMLLHKTVASIEVVIAYATTTFHCLYSKIVASIEVVVVYATTNFVVYIAKSSHQ